MGYAPIHPHRVLAGAAVAALGCAVGPAAGLAQLVGGGTTQPATGLDAARVGDLGSALQTYLPSSAGGAVAPRTIGPNWQISPSIGLDIGLTDNALRVNSPRRADVFALLTPSILVSADTARIQANASYTPSISIYASNSSQSRVDQFGQAGALVTLVPETMFLDLRGSVSESSLVGGFGTADGRGFNRNNQVTSVALSATPYVQHRFGGWGTGQVGYSIAQTFQSQPNGVLANQGFINNGISAGPAFFGSSGDLTTQRERASFTTGENLGRINNLSVVSATQYSGTGSYRGAYRNEVSTTTGYAVTRNATALGTIGYQDLHYAGTPPYNINQPLWSVGGRYAPNPNLSVTLTYGRRDGIEDFAANAFWSPTARTAIYANYSTGLTSSSEEYQNVLETTSVGPTGLLTDRVTGAPVSTGGSSFFGNQNGVFQLRRVSVTGLLSYSRDSFTATVTNERRTSVTNLGTNTGAGIVPPGTTTTGTYGTLSWGHQFSERLTGNVSASYGVNDNGAAFGQASGSQTSFTGTAGLGYIFTQTLTGRVQYTHTSSSGTGSNSFNNFNTFGSRSGSYDENALLAGLRKSF